MPSHNVRDTMTKTVKPGAQSSVPRLRPLCAAVLSVLSACQAAWAADSNEKPLMVAQVEFEKDFLAPGSSAATNLSRFEKGDAVLPGVYNVDIYVNDNWVGREDVPFKTLGTSEGNARACFDRTLLMRVGADLSKLAAAAAETVGAADGCLPIERAIDGATASFDFGEQRLDLSVPQISMRRNPRGYVSPEFWSNGVNAAFLGYDANVYTYNTYGQGAQTQGYLGINAGANLGAWHFRHNGSYSWSTQGSAQYQSLNTYLQRDIPRLSAQLTIGESYTSGDLFDSVGFRGVRLATDDRMLPDSLRGYAPIVRGVANSNAKVTIKQSGSVIYDTTVAPGAFEINDLYATGYGGDLTVEVTEADGSVHSFKVPYAAVPLSLRPGISRFSVAAGTLRDTQTAGNPFFMQGTWQRGFTNALTGYVGTTIAQGYASMMAGGVLNTRIGAIGADYTQARTWLHGYGASTGGSARVSYSKNVPETGTNVSIAAYRYSTGGYFDLNAAMQARDAVERLQTGISTVMRPRNRAQITLGQTLGSRGGYLSLTTSTVNYWNRSGSDVNYSVGYSNSIRNINFSVQATRQQSAFGTNSTMYYASVTIPLGRNYPITVNSSVSYDTSGRTQVQSMLTGSLGVDRNLSYGVNVNHGSGNGASSTSGGANVLYHSRLADISATVGSGTGYSQGSAGIRGALVAHPGGITLSQPLSDTFGIVEAKGAAGARVLNSSGVKLDGRGYAIVPYLTPYSLNSVDIDPKGLSTDVELKVTSQQVAPHAGAIPLLKYETETGRSAVIYAKRANGEPVPFGANVLDEQGNHVGIVGQASKMFVRGLQRSGVLSVGWGDGPDAHCRITYDLPVREGRADSDGYQRVDAQCLPDAAAAPAPTVKHSYAPRTGPDAPNDAVVR